MKLHRFYVQGAALEHTFWVKDPGVYRQWTKVLRFQVGREVVLFNDQQHEKMYRILAISSNAVQVELVTEMVAQQPQRNVYLCFALLKKDKNDWIMQKGTELGVRHFVPMITARVEKTGFDVDRSTKIVIEAAEQCGRVDIPRVREPMTLQTAITEMQSVATVYIAQQGEPSAQAADHQLPDTVAVLIGPEGGWTDAEKQLCVDMGVEHLRLGMFTLRAETAAIAAAVHTAI